MTVRHGLRVAQRTQDGERGAVLVELAIISIFLLTLVAGTYDFGQGWRTGLVVNEATRTGARVGSARGPLRDADFYALSGVKAALSSSGQLANVSRVVIFKSTAADGAMPAACKTTSTTACQTITGTAFKTAWENDPVATATTTTGCLNIATTKNWCPTTRINVQTTAEYYGIWIQLRHDYQFPILGDGIDVARTTVMRLEPKND